MDGVDCASTSASSSQQSWDDFNYPPVLNLWHYAPSELDRGLRVVARTAHTALMFALLALTLNVLFNIALMVLGHDKPIHIMYSIFNLLLGTIIGMWATMDGYKGMATNKSKLMRRYLFVWGLLTVGMMIASFLAVINFNGWARVVQLLQRPEAGSAGPVTLQTFWLVGSAIESSVWTLAYSTPDSSSNPRDGAWLSAHAFGCRSAQSFPSSRCP